MLIFFSQTIQIQKVKKFAQFYNQHFLDKQWKGTKIQYKIVKYKTVQYYTVQKILYI